MSVNARTKYVFTDKHETGPALRSLTFDEATMTALAINSLANNTRQSPRPISLKEFLIRLGDLTDLPSPDRYLRPVYEFIQRLVAIGALAEVALPLELAFGDLSSKLYRVGVDRTIEEHFATELAAAALGIPYVAHRYNDIAVRVHSYDGRRNPIGIGSGVVLSAGLVVTNRHVVEGAAKIAISWGGSEEIEAKAWKIHSEKAIDLAVIAVDGFDYYPHVWVRDPRQGEEVVIIAHPNIPQVETRPVLTFTGVVASGDYVTTYYGDDQTIICSVMGPGASGGPVLGADGQLVGLVVQLLEGLYKGEALQPSIFHAIIPGEVLLRELPKLHPIFRFKNTFGSGEEAAQAIAEHQDKWWLTH